MSGDFLETLFPPAKPIEVSEFKDNLIGFRDFGEETRRIETRGQTFGGEPVSADTFVNEFWTAQQRQANNLHEISYRACFKPQLPRFFIERLTKPGEFVYDPFMGRGTTLIEAALLGRIPLGCDVNPLSAALIKPRLRPPTTEEVEQRLSEIDFSIANEWPEELLVFYHHDTLKQIVALKEYLLGKGDRLDAVDEWIRMVAINRLTGHSAGFFSVYTLPPNQAVSVKSQQKINTTRNQTPPNRNVPGIILKKSRSLMKDLDEASLERLRAVGARSLLLTGLSSQTFQIPEKAVSLVVTSPPFLNVVDYATDNWLRCWFIGIDAQSVKLTVPRKLGEWQVAMTEVFRELHRILKPGGHIAFEVGEVHGGKTKLDEAVLPCGLEAGLKCELILINDQEFTKTANCWGVNNNAKGTNTNRIVLFRRP